MEKWELFAFTQDVTNYGKLYILKQDSVNRFNFLYLKQFFAI